MKNKSILATLLLLSSTVFAQVSYIKDENSYSPTSWLTIQKPGGASEALDIENMTSQNEEQPKLVDSLNTSPVNIGEVPNISGKPQIQDTEFPIESTKSKGLNPMTPPVSASEAANINNGGQSIKMNSNNKHSIPANKSKNQEKINTNIIKEDISSFNKSTIEQFEKQGKETTEKKYLDFLIGN